MRLYFPVDLTGDLIMIEKLVLGDIWTGDLTIINPDTVTSAPSRQARVNTGDPVKQIRDGEHRRINRLWILV